MYDRYLDIKNLVKRKSIILLGPRATGKSYLLRSEFEGEALYINLLKSSEYLKLSQNPSDLEGMISAQPYSLIIIDEVQKIPALLDEVHRLIEEKSYKFILTGSSARRLKANQANLLAGRAWLAHLYPLTHKELSQDFNLEKYLRYGSLPAVYSSQDPDEDLDAYVQTYISEEIKAEGIIRKIPQFARFLKSAALSNGEQINFENIARDCQVPPSTVREYFYILHDTLIGYFLEPWIESKKRKAIATAKFYFFDAGVTNTLIQLKTVEKNTNLWGNRFEQFIGNEIRAYLSYGRVKETLYYWRSTTGFEVDFLFGDTAVEVKSTQSVNKSHLKGLEALREEKKFKKYVLVSNDKINTVQNNIQCLYWRDFLEKLWAGDFN